VAKPGNQGFPETYDRRRLVRFLSEVKSGAASVVAPVYSHLIYDVVPRGGHAHRESGHPDPGRPQRPTPTRSRAKLILH
jgi:hypothetical protein